MENALILKESSDYVKSLLDQQELEYHNWLHTDFVRRKAREIANSVSELSEDDQFYLELAAIFHDAGYVEGSKNHEERSATMATEFLSEKGIEQEGLNQISSIIRATAMAHEPDNLLEKIIKDADLAHFAEENFVDKLYKNLLREVNANIEVPFSKDKWRNATIELLQKHEYYTKYGQNTFDPKKQANLAEMLRVKKKREQKKEQKETKTKKEKAQKPDLPEKGVETMFRVSLRNHLNLSNIADNKANTLISVNAIIISIVLSTLFPKIDNNAYLLFPGLMLLLFSIATIVLSILSTLPKTTHGKLSRLEVEKKRGNLLFFGNFHSMEQDDFEWGMKELMKDKDYLYSSLIRDLYFLGKVLNRKYTLLRYSYIIFILGLVVSLFLFAYQVWGISAH